MSPREIRIPVGERRGSKASSSRKVLKASSVRRKEDRAITPQPGGEVMHPAVMAYSGGSGETGGGSLEDSFIQFGMDAIRAHLEGNRGGINPLPQSPLEQMLKKARSDKKAASHAVLSSTSSQQHSFRAAGGKQNSVGLLAPK